MNKVHFSSGNDHWSTPNHIYEELNEKYRFNFDPCPFNSEPIHDGLSIEWGTRCFVNPPYSDLRNWCEKAYNESLKGKLVVMLIPSRTDTRAWHDYVMKADEIIFIKGRLRFGDSKNNAPFPSAIVIFNKEREEDGN